MSGTVFSLDRNKSFLSLPSDVHHTIRYSFNSIEMNKIVRKKSKTSLLRRLTKKFISGTTSCTKDQSVQTSFDRSIKTKTPLSSRNSFVSRSIEWNDVCSFLCLANCVGEETSITLSIIISLHHSIWHNDC